MKTMILSTRNTLAIADTIEQASRRTASAVITDLKQCILEKGYATWQVSSGGTPKRVYEIITGEMADQLDWNKVTLVQMDEYAGVKLTDPISQYAFLDESLVTRLPFADVLAFDNVAMNNPALFEQRIKRVAGIDVAIHGIGVNGHLAFNEPHSNFNSRTRIVELADSTRLANSRFFDCKDLVPTHGITVGLGTAMEAAKIYLLAFGREKRKAVFNAIVGRCRVANPASILQAHGNAVYMLDREAASDTWVAPLRNQPERTAARLPYVA